MNQAMLASRHWQILVVAIWMAAALAALPFAVTLNEKLDTSVRLEGSESSRVDAALKNDFKSPFTKIVLLRIVGLPEPRLDAGREPLRQIVDTIGRTAGVQGVMSYLDRDDSLFVGKDGSSIVIVGISPAAGSGRQEMANLYATGEGLRRQYEGSHPKLALHWTGEAAVGADLRRLSGAETRAAELRILPITALLLLVAFRSVVAALLPVICGVMTLLISLGTLAILNRVWPASIIVVSIISMVGLGISVDTACS